jgi:hypothetical protein
VDLALGEQAAGAEHEAARDPGPRVAPATRSHTRSDPTHVACLRRDADDAPLVIRRKPRLFADVPAWPSPGSFSAPTPCRPAGAEVKIPNMFQR